MKNKPDCTVIIPVYNAEKTVCRAIESIFASGSDAYLYEVLVVDDGSADGTATAVLDLCAGYPSVRLLQKENGGVSFARNTGLQNARGHFVYFMDADDEVIRSALDEMIGRAYETGADMMIADFERYIDATEEKTAVAPELPENRTLNESFIKSSILLRFIDGDARALSPLWNKLYVRQRIDACGLRFNENRTHGEDWEFNIRYFENAASVYYDSRLLYRYYLNGTQQSYGKYRKGLVQGFAEGYGLLKELIRRHSLFELDGMIYQKLQRNTAYNFISALRTEGVSVKEKKALLRLKEAKDVFGQLAKADEETLAALDLSRKDKMAFLLLSKGEYRLALKMI